MCVGENHSRTLTNYGDTCLAKWDVMHDTAWEAVYLDGYERTVYRFVFDFIRRASIFSSASN